FSFTASSTSTPSSSPTSTSTSSPTATLSFTSSPTLTAIPTVFPSVAGKVIVYPQPAEGDGLTFSYVMDEPGSVLLTVFNERGDLAAKAEEDKSAGPQVSK